MATGRTKSNKLFAEVTADLTPEQIEEFKKAFSSIDLNKDGKISNKELVQAAKLLGINITAEEAKDLIRSVDLDKDGNISLEEYVLLMKDTYLRIELTCERYKASFMLIDQNNDGVISFEELVRALAFKKEQYDLNQVREIFSAADSDKDGSINFKEFATSSLPSVVFGE
ncbi:calmodulin-like protein 5 isoform X2 [Ostrea edulis]|uniref:calmodulin-like protein 5 isoform X2 n=1 Tax=Ostrea edulis TaxID=37623 RepID=UPI002095D08E|nr:calmodulin-like protein 5 isoform X2 [Ostrea edulis]